MHMHAGAQHDAADFLNVILDGADSILKSKGGPNMTEMVGGRVCQSRHCAKCGSGYQVGCNHEYVLRLRTGTSSAWTQNNVPGTDVHKPMRLVDLIHAQSWSSPLPNLMCTVCGVPPADASAQIREVFHWVHTADTFVTCLERFKADG